MDKLDRKLLRYIDLLVERYPILKDCKNDIIDGYLILEQCYLNRGKLLIAGNGGSAADSQHIVGELMKSFRIPRPISTEFKMKLVVVGDEQGEEVAKNLQGSLPAIPLVANEALISAYSNDVNSECIFAQQVYGYAQPHDVFLGISTSGNSKNVVYAAIVAKALNLKILSLTGINGGCLKKMSDVSVKVPESETYKIQELHLPIYHCWSMMLEERFFAR